jgi:hypothetical protein
MNEKMDKMHEALKHLEIQQNEQWSQNEKDKYIKAQMKKEDKLSKKEIERLARENDVYKGSAGPSSPQWSEISSPTYPQSHTSRHSSIPELEEEDELIGMPSLKLKKPKGRPIGSKNTITMYKEALAKGLYDPKRGDGGAGSSSMTKK